MLTSCKYDKVMNLFRSYASHDKNSRLEKAQKIMRIISRYKDFDKSDVLDIGCGSGYLGSILGKKAKSYTGIDFIDERKVRNFCFLISTALRLPFKSGSFDIVICNHVIEHVPEQDKVLDEINRVLKKDGICYITSPNKLWPIEPHLKLPFLSLLPRRIADAYVRIAGKGKNYDIYPMTYTQFNNKLKMLFRIENYTLEILKCPHDYGFKGNVYSIFAISRHLPKGLLNMINRFLPNWIIILRKKIII